MKTILQLFLCLSLFALKAQENRWKINTNGGITWTVGSSDTHKDHIEMSGKYISTVVNYGVNEDGSFFVNRHLVFPMLRTIPNDTHASFTESENIDPIKCVYIDPTNSGTQENKIYNSKEVVKEIKLDGKLCVTSILNNCIRLERTMFPSTDIPAYAEKFVLTNITNKPVYVETFGIGSAVSSDTVVRKQNRYETCIETYNTREGGVVLKPNESYTYYMSITADVWSNEPITIDVEKELTKRNEFLSFLNKNLVLETPNQTLNTAFSFAKIRASESIYQTKGGPMHSPGGLHYYAAIWTNDQAEYVNPFFPFLGYEYGIASAVNSYAHFARYMNAEYKPIPTSIIAEGTGTWQGAGDRGDAAMIAYGASRFALMQGDAKIAENLWTLIEWCLEYSKRKLIPAGVVASDSDELEGRFPTGKANLCTSSLYYDALNSAVYLGEALGKDKKQIASYKKEATDLKINIEKYFGAKVMGYDTYQYYEGNDKLRAWICIPLTMNIFDRKNGTIEALFSPDLWTADGLATQSGEKTFWDRASLYALRGVFAAGDTKRGIKFLDYYSNRRLLGEHVPYPVEAYPEGNQRHLSAESGLYCRIYTEGLFGIRPVSLKSFTLSPQLPEGWDYMNLRNIHGFQTAFDVEVKRENQKLRVIVKRAGAIVANKLISNGETTSVFL